MIAKQVSVFLENKSGRLNEVTRILGEAGINISAFYVADTSDFGVLRMIVPDPDLAVRVLKAESFSVQTTPVVLMRTLNQPGSLARALKILSDENVFIEYLYAFSMNENSAVVVIRPSEIDQCVRVLEAHRSRLLAE
ncbi:ACT domain-containing protein [bacterium]|nr:ACT domain-containing protein [bacterium]